jgi:hypothetical protein
MNAPIANLNQRFMLKLILTALLFGGGCVLMISGFFITVGSGCSSEPHPAIIGGGITFLLSGYYLLNQFIKRSN